MTICNERKQNSKKIGVFGSAFNPPHCGHEDVIKQSLAHVDEVLVVPSYCHAFGKKMAPYDNRLKMAEAMVKGLNSADRVNVCDIERTLATKADNGRAIYTFDVLNALAKIHPHDTLVFILGPDNACPETWSKFYRAQDIVERWTIFEAKESIAVRSSSIREKLAQGLTITQTECPASIIQVVNNMKWYRDNL